MLSLIAAKVAAGKLLASKIASGNWLVSRVASAKVAAAKSGLIDDTYVPALFLHIQKTAGTSVVEMAAQHYGNMNTSSHGDYVGRSPEDFVNTLFVSGHFGFEWAKPLIDGRYSFTFLRDPGKRILSLYYFYRSQPADTFPMYRIAHENDLAAFLRLGLSDPLVKSRIWNNQTWQLACGYGNNENKGVDVFPPEKLLELAKANLDQLSYVGFAETFNQDITEIARNLGMPGLGEVRHANKGKPRPVDELGEEECSLLQELTVLDRELYDYAKNKRTVVVIDHG